MITIVIVDDHKMLRQGIRMALETECDLQVVGEADDGLEGLNLIERIKPDIALVDIMMKGMNGIELTRRLKDLVPDTKIIIVSMLDSQVYKEEAFEAGAKGYVVKGSGIEELIATIRQVQAGGQS